MENSSPLRKRLRRTLQAAVIGALIFDGMIVGDNAAYDLWQTGHLSNQLYDYVAGVAVILCIPSAFVSEAIGFKGGLVNEYFVNGVLGALLFGSIYAFYGFIKDSNER